jgi:hypothetical protein
MTDAAAPGLAPEYLIRRAGDPHPSDTSWTLKEAQDAADYNAQRWGADQWEVVTRQVTPYTVVPSSVPSAAAPHPRNLADGLAADYLRGVRDARAAVAASDRFATAGRFPGSGMTSDEVRAALTAIDALIAAASKTA